MLRSFLICAVMLTLLTACDDVTITISSNPAATQFPTPLPIIITVTPITSIAPITATFPPAPFTETFTSTPIPPTALPPEATLTPTLEPTFTATAFDSSPTTTGPTPFVSIKAVILGCNTSIDLTHGMGEVTNAYVTISNIGTQELDNVCATLNALDEGKAHPDKTKCVTMLPAGHQVTQKLTVDTTFNKPTPIQVDITDSLGLLDRIAQDSCTNIGLLIPSTGDLGVVKPIP